MRFSLVFFPKYHNGFFHLTQRGTQVMRRKAALVHNLDEDLIMQEKEQKKSEKDEVFLVYDRRVASVFLFHSLKDDNIFVHPLSFLKIQFPLYQITKFFVALGKVHFSRLMAKKLPLPLKILILIFVTWSVNLASKRLAAYSKSTLSIGMDHAMCSQSNHIKCLSIPSPDTPRY